MDIYLKSYTKIISKCIKDVNVRAKTITLLGKSIKGKVHDITVGNNFLDMTSPAQETKEEIKWTTSKFKTSVL